MYPFAQLRIFLFSKLIVKYITDASVHQLLHFLFQQQHLHFHNTTQILAPAVLPFTDFTSRVFRLFFQSSKYEKTTRSQHEGCSLTLNICFVQHLNSTIVCGSFFYCGLYFSNSQSVQYVSLFCLVHGNTILFLSATVRDSSILYNNFFVINKTIRLLSAYCERLDTCTFTS